MEKICTRRGTLVTSLALLLTLQWVAPSQAAEPIKVGASLSLSGRFSDSAKYVQEGYQLWVDEVNAHGGLRGRQVQLITYDDESNPDTARVLTERLITRDGVLMILGPYSSPITDAVATVTERAQVPMFGTIASDSSIWERRALKWTFQAFPSSTYDHEGFLEILAAKGKGLKKLAIVFEEAPFSIGGKNWALETAKKMGYTVETYGYAPGAQDFRSIVERIVAFKPDVVSMGGYYQPSIALTRQIMERGFNPVAYHFIQAADGVTKEALGANAEGIFGRSAWEATLPNAPSKAFAAAYKAKFNRIPSYHSAAAYAAGQWLAAGVKAKGTDRIALREFFATQTTPTLLGNAKVNAKLQQDGYKYVAIQWQGGQSKIVDAGSKTILWPKPAWK